MRCATTVGFEKVAPQKRDAQFIALLHTNWASFTSDRLIRGGRCMSSMHLNREDTFPMDHFHASEVVYTPVVQRSNVINIRNVEK